MILQSNPIYCRTVCHLTMLKAILVFTIIHEKYVLICTDTIVEIQESRTGGEPRTPAVKLY